MNFYKHHIGDYDSHTQELTWSQDLVYRRLISAYYLRERPLPDDLPLLCRMVKATEASHKAAVRYVLGRFFELRKQVGGGGADPISAIGTGAIGTWHNRRCDEEIVKYQAQVETNRRTARSTNRTSNRGTNRSPNQNQIPDTRTTPINQSGIEPTRIEQPPDPFDEMESQKHDDYPEVAAKPPQPKHNGERWWLTPPGIDKRGAEVGIKPERGEDYAQFKDRIFQEIARLRQAGSQGQQEH